MKLEEKTVNKKYIYKGKIINLRCDDALLPDGTPCKREIVEHPGGAAVLCVKDGKVALVKQFRYAYGEELYEIPAGKLEAGEDPKLAAERELSEETGLTAKELVHLFTIYPTPGYTNEKIYIYEAKGIQEGVRHLDEGEFLNVEYLPLDRVYELIESGKICDAKTVVALLAYRNNGKQK
ncbi:MAG: NUDIX hydrolase [Clostridia bacterium]|nr:NUDIX hydrolase [Clostridia bacterium]